MPRENKHGRGRREEKKLKRKREKGEDEPHESKKQKPAKVEEEVDTEDFIHITGTDNAPADEAMVEEAEGGTERPFYGLLTDEEQEYFRRADELLEVNNFPDAEERSLFLANVFREAEGKELKISCSQSCSRLMERLILLSTVEQKKKLFGTFSGNFAHLVQHRFASHCCEMLFIQSAGIVTEELSSGHEEKEGEVFVSMENLFLYTLNELEGQMTFLLTDRFASHTLRVLLVILSGRPIEMTATKSLMQSKKKEKVSISGLPSTSEISLETRTVPSSFTFAVQKIITDTISTMDDSFIRILATHPTGNPSLQLLLELELTSKTPVVAGQKTILSTLLPDDPSVEGSQSATFISGLLYDSIGSRLLETLVTYAPGKLFKSLHRSIFKARIAGLARNEIASYVAIKILNRLSKEDLLDAISEILPQVQGLIERHRTMVVKTLLERCHARSADTKQLTEAIASAYGSDPSTLVLKMVDIDSSLLTTLTATLMPAASSGDQSSPQATPPPRPSPAQTHGSLLAQTLLSIPGPPSSLLEEALLSLPHETILLLALWTPTSHILQSSLLPSPSNLTFRRRLISTLITPPSAPGASSETDPILTLATSLPGSHILDSLLLSAPSLLPLIERIALTLTTPANEHELRESWAGRIVWRNWNLDLWKRWKGEWVKKVQSDAAASAPVPVLAAIASEKKDGKERKGKDAQGGKQGNGKAWKGNEGKTAIQLAREKFAATKAAVGGTSKTKKGAKAKGGERATGANAGAVGLKV
jgi:nucleolar protein 9